MKIIYCFDAYCGWCYGFSSQIKEMHKELFRYFHFDVLSGGMVLPSKPVHIRQTASYIYKNYPAVEEASGVKFGNEYLWHIKNPEESDWYPHSEKPAIALCVLKEYFPGKQVELAADIQFALYYEGRDLCDDEAYRALIEKYKIPETDFYDKLHDPRFKEQAYAEFDLVKQLQVTGFPSVFLQATENKFYLLARGFTNHQMMKQRLEAILKELKQ